MSFLTQQFRHKTESDLVIKAHLVMFMTRKASYSPQPNTKFFAYRLGGTPRVYLREEHEFNDRFYPAEIMDGKPVFTHKSKGGLYQAAGDDSLYTTCAGITDNAVIEDGQLVWLAQYVSGVADMHIGKVFFMNLQVFRDFYDAIDPPVVNFDGRTPSPPDPNSAKVPFEIILTSEVGPGDNKAVMKFANGKEVTVTADDWLMFIRFMRDIIHG